MMSRLGLCFALMGAVVLLASGCSGGDVGQVTGVVTLDGKPIENATIAFYPSTGRASMAMTDAEGKYELVYTQSQKGAVIGEHKVTISTEIDEEVEYGDTDYETDDDAVAEEDVVSEARAETMPEKYRELNKTELTASVKGGSNTIDFALTTE